MDCAGNNVTKVCDPGSTQACLCSGGIQGVQTCFSDGTSWGQCTGCSVGKDVSIDGASRPNDGGSLDRANKEARAGDSFQDGWKCKSNSDCDDGISCTVDLCGSGGCAHIVSSGFCLIGQTCIVSGTANLQNSCQKCDPPLNSNTWTDDDGKSCDDGQACTHSCRDPQLPAA